MGRGGIPLGVKLAALTALILTVVGVLVSVALSAKERERVIAAKEAAGAMVTNLVAASLSAPLIFEDQIAIEEQVGFLESNDSVTSLVVWRNGVEKPLLNWRRGGAAGSEASLRTPGNHRFSDRLEIFRMIPGSDGKPIGQVSVSFTLEPENRHHRRSWWNILLFALGVSLGTAILLNMVVRHQVVAPLRTLAAATRTLRLDGVLRPVTPRARDEIGELAMAFNRMGQAVVERSEYLRGELAIAVQIQTSILPRQLDVPGLEICARMQPAAEAGGDYYEVLPTRDGAWLGIGDVTGHGLNAGLTMMMLQGMVSALVKRDPDESPAALVADVNRALHENLRERLKTTDHVTLSLMRYRSDGTLKCAGAHLPLVVYRAREKELEVRETDGVWTAIAPDVSRMNPELELFLEEGDVLVLYTDGIEEALDQAGEMFGAERFHEALLEVIHRPLPEIVDHVLAATTQWCGELQDDVTLVVARRTEK